MPTITDKTKAYLNMLECKFNEEKFYRFIKDLLNLGIGDIKNNRALRPTTEQYMDYIDTSKLYAKYTDSKRNQIGVLLIKLCDKKQVANARTLQRNYIAHLLDCYSLNAAIVAIYSNTDETWRLSFVKQELNFSDGKFKLEFTPAKRYSYLLGENEPNHTAKAQLLELLENNNKQYTVDEIEEKFSVEKVTKEFFEIYKENYKKLKVTLDNNKDFLGEAKKCGFTSEEFAKKVMGQIVFIYFLQKKGWLGVNLVPNKISIKEYEEIYNNCNAIERKVLDDFYITSNNKKIVKFQLLENYKENKQKIECLSNIFKDSKYDKNWGTGEKKFIRKIYNTCKNRNKNFFNDYLEPFFYNGLNEKRKNDYFSRFNCKIPFLNGGLFEPFENYQWEILNFNFDNKIFSNDDETGILDFFDRYNFTMNEEEPLEKDVAVDPEMLGKIFESLLDVDDRKAKGAFYTPREIVHYMCQESLANYLVNKVGVDYDEIKKFIQYGEIIRDYDLKNAIKNEYKIGKTIFDNIIKIDEALKNIKIADPAVGSGAFPLGMLNEIVKLRDILTSYLEIYCRIGKLTINDISNNRTMFDFKWNAIKNNIYGVDIENSAVDITKLRLWLSIVVDKEGEPVPLPNLNCKIMQGNSLIDEYEGIKLIDSKFIEELKDRDNVKFNSGNNSNRKYKLDFDQIEFGDFQEKAIIDKLIDLKKKLYGETDPIIKKRILDEIQSDRRILLRHNFAGTNKISKLLEIDKSHNKPYFAWMLEFIEVFIENDGFDVVIGNPPYGLINKKQNQQETIKMSEEQIKYIKASKEYESAKGGLLNIYRLFICKSHYLLKESGNMCLIFPMAFMCDLSASKLRKFIINNDTINFIEAFPERDNENKRVFRAAKMSVCILQCQKGKKENINNEFYVRTHWDKYVDYKNEKVIMNYNIIKEIDEQNYTIPLINNKELKIIRKIIKNSSKMEEYSKCYEGEVNLTFHKSYIYNINKNFERLIRGAQVQRYIITDTVSQGEVLYLDKEKFLDNITSEKSRHFKNKRIVMQGITGINEKHRLKMALLKEGEFCANSANYIIENPKISIEYILGILNSNLMNWYFKKMSTNSNVNGYEIDKLPIKEKKVKELIEKVKEYLERKKITGLKEDIDIMEKNIDKIVYQIYELSDEEIKYIEEN